MSGFNEVTGAFSAPFNGLTRQYRPTLRRDYADGVVVVAYYCDRLGERFLVWDGGRGLLRHDLYPESGFYWGEARSLGWAANAYRRGKRASFAARRLIAA